MSNRHLLKSRISFHFLVWWIFFGCFPGLISSFVVTLESMEIFRTHDWISEPTVYFQCKGENRTMLSHVIKPGVVYSFKGEESWQPVTQLDAKKCKRCGFYEKDFIKSDDIFVEWEFCASDFRAPQGIYILFKERQLNVTFHCKECAALAGASHKKPQKQNEEEDDNDDDSKVMRIIIILLITALVSTVTIIVAVVAYKYWQKKKRQQDQARFLKLFEEGDDIEDELGLGSEI